jgi:hypothetical protein
MVRERWPRYKEEPRYKRLDFVRARKPVDDEEWELLEPAQPHRAIQIYEGPVYYPSIDYQHYVGGPQAVYGPGWHMGHPMHQQPQPPLSHRAHLAWTPQRQIEHAPPGPRKIVQSNQGQRGGWNEKDAVATLETCSPRPRSLGRSKFKVVHTGHSIFGDSSSDESDDYGHNKGQRQKYKGQKSRGRSRSRYCHHFSDNEGRKK